MRRGTVDSLSDAPYDPTAMERSSEGALLAAAQAGDGRAFAEICRRYGALVEHRIRRHVRGPLLRKLDVADVVQEALLVAHQRLGEFELQAEGCLGPWLGAIAELKAREAVRHHVAAERRSIGREVGPDARPPTGAFRGTGPTPSQCAMAGEQRQDLQQAMDGLSADHAAVLRLVVGDGLTLADAAAALGRSYEATKKLYGRALSALALRMEASRPGRPKASEAGPEAAARAPEPRPPARPARGTGRKAHPGPR